MPIKKQTILLDDEPNSIRLLEFLLAKSCPEIEVTGAFTDAEDGLAAILRDPPDLLFLDIEMPHLNGFELLDRCPQPLPFHLIFTTAYDRYAVRAFRYSALDFLLKPVSEKDLCAAVEKAIGSQSPDPRQVDIFRQFNPRGGSKNQPTRLTISTLEGLTYVAVDDILHCDSEGAYTKIHLAGEPPLLVSKSIKEIEEMLDYPFFFRAHHSHLVNLKQVKKFLRTDGNDALMASGALVPIARNRKQAFLEAMSQI